LSSKVPIAYIDIRTLAHATEDIDKVEAALRNTMPNELVNTVVLKKTNLTGHHGNSIVLLETRIKEKGAVQGVFRKLSAGLGIMDKEFLAGEIKQHLEKGNLYIRLDKQSAYMNELRLGKTDPIHFKVHFKKSDVEEVVKICRESGLVL
jgi:RNA binding exosome subunit